MDKTNISYRIKKYFFFISIVFIILTTAHLFYSFLYSDSKEIAIKGGSISEGLIGKVPSLNPLKNKTIEDKYVNSILYRSLLKYDIKKDKIVGDLAKCDIKDLLNVTCFLKANQKWSNGEDIIKEDIIKTYEVLKDSRVNGNMYSLLKNVKIEKIDEGIVFHNKTKDVQFLKIFFQPIVSHKVLNLISKNELEGDFKLSNGVYSGKYVVKNIISDENMGFTTIILNKNKEYIKNPVYIDTIFLKVFPDFDSFLKNKDSINIFNDTNHLLGKNNSRFEFNKYELPQHINIFTNIEKLKNNKIRKFILDEIDKSEIIKKIGEEKVEKVNDLFFSDIYIKKNNKNINLKIELSKEGYFSKEDLLEKYNKKLKIEQIKLSSNISGEISINKISGEQKVKDENKDNKKVKYKEIKIKNQKSKIIYSPNWVDKYNFVTRNDYILKGNTQKNTTKVFINDYELKSFRPYSKTFSYRISEKKGNFKIGQNTYKIYFEINGVKKLIEEINFYHNKDKKILKQKEKEILNSTIKVKIEDKNSDKKQKSENKIKGENKKNISFEELENTKKELNKIKQKIEKIKELDGKYYYNEDLKKYSLELYFTSGKKFYRKTAEYIKEKLGKKGILVEIRDIKASDLDKLLREGKDNYDLLLVGINLSYFKFDIYTYFHSTIYSNKEGKWIDNPYNLSNYKGLDLDIPLEELKGGLFSKDITELSEKKILKVIENNNLSKTLFTPILYNLVDKNIKGYTLKEKIPEYIYRFEGLEKSYVKKEKIINTENKNILEYIKFLFNTLKNGF